MITEQVKLGKSLWTRCSMKQNQDKLFYEKIECNAGKKYIAGCDEVGRGPLAGPVVCAAVIMPLGNIIEGVDDSKKLSPKKREKLFDEIIRTAVAVQVEFIYEQEIDELNILQATKKCMAKAINNLSVRPDVCLVDAVKNLDTDIKIVSIIHGDALSYSIGAASIVAKVIRDRFMDEQDKIYPEYGFAKNKGYGTKFHMDVLKKIGPSPIHRKTFIKFLGEDNV